MRGLKRKFDAARGIARSLRVYRLDRAHARRLEALYGRFLKPGDLAFDVGAHVGDRVAAFRRLGAEVVAVEPQPAALGVLRLLHGRERAVHIVPAAVSDTPGRLTLHLNTRNPTVTTASKDFVAAAEGALGWEGQVWDERLEVEAVTLDGLIARFGEPAFVKIDVEGHEDSVLAGLTRPVKGLSFEFTTIQKDVAHRALAQLERLGYARFDASLGESGSFVFGEPVDLATLRGWIDTLPAEANSGDVYAMAGESIFKRSGNRFA
jgi:FkbM family methyltransferase